MNIEAWIFYVMFCGLLALIIISSYAEVVG